MALLAVQADVPAGNVPAYTAATNGGDTMPAGDHNVLQVKNGSGGAITVTIAGNVPCNQGFTHNVAVSVAAGASEEIGPLPASRFGDVNGLVTITYSAVASLTVAAVSS